MTIPMTAFGWPPRRSRGGSRLPGNICTLTTPIFCKGGSRQEESCRRSDSTSDNRIPKCLIARDPKLKSNRLQDYNLGRDALPTTCFPRHCVSFPRARVRSLPPPPKVPIYDVLEMAYRLFHSTTNLSASRICSEVMWSLAMGRFGFDSPAKMNHM